MHADTVIPAARMRGGDQMQDLINFLYSIRGEMFYWSLMGLVLVWVADVFGLWSRWGR
jgi:hypothetical protein